MQSETHIFFCWPNYFFRILAFSTSKIQSVEVYINNKWIGLARNVEGPLYVLRWNPDQYSHGVHTISVTVQVKLT